ncbi:MAG TPA: FkbM family methyltransferase [Acidimicrobiales bacterium]|nr:FkbM family methyltransferase [Acidimicrobiales bacterium]
MTSLPRAAKSIVAPRRGNLQQLELTERGRKLSAWCPDDEVFTLCRELVLDRVYERNGLALHPGMGTVVDAGAHVGIFSLLASQWAERVIALEANELNFRVLDLNVARNALTNVEPRHCALWSVSSGAVGFAPAHHSGGGVVAEIRPGLPDTVEVRATSLDDLVSELGKIDLLKIDIEGAEYDVLRAATALDTIGAIVGEMHIERDGDRTRLDALAAHLETAGFEVGLVSEAQLLARDCLARLWSNRDALKGRWLIKALAAGYYLAPVKKPIRPPGATYELPILIAHR